MANKDKIFFGALIGFVFPFILGLLSTVLWFYIDKDESRAFIYLSSGILLGSIIDAKYLKKWINKRYELGLWFIILVYLVYNIGLYGFFMGFPVFNVFLGMVGGYYFGKRICFKNVKPEMHPVIIKQVSYFTSAVMIVICLSSGYIAIADKGIGENIKGMLGLDFEIFQAMVLTVIIAGGTGLVASQYFITRLTMQRTIRSNNKIS